MCSTDVQHMESGVNVLLVPDLCGQVGGVQCAKPLHRDSDVIPSHCVICEWTKAGEEHMLQAAVLALLTRPLDFRDEVGRRSGRGVGEQRTEGGCLAESLLVHDA